MRPPPWAERLLSWFYRGPGGGEIAGDLAEELDAVAHARGRRAARRWYRRQVLRSIGAKLLAKARPGALDTRRERLMSGFLSETRLGLRSLIRRPGFAIAALATLALGLGASTAMFAVVDAVLLRPLPYAHASGLITLRQIDRETQAGPDRISPATFLDWRDTARTCDDVAVVRPWTFTFTGGSQPEEIDAGLVSAGFFDLIGVRAAIGRTFTPADHEAGGSVPVVVSDRLWRRLFGADPSVIGTTVPFEDLRLTIVGVLPSTFWWIDRDQLMWAPYSLAESARRLRAQTYLTAVGRDVRAARGRRAAWPQLRPPARRRSRFPGA